MRRVRSARPSGLCIKQQPPRRAKWPRETESRTPRHGEQLDATFARNPKAPEFGTYGVLYIRWGKAARGGDTSPPQCPDGPPLVGAGAAAVGHRVPGPVRRAQQTGWLWPTERSSRLSEVALSARFSRYRDDARPAGRAESALAATLLCHAPDPGWLRPVVRPAAVGHSYASTTALYTSVSAGYRSQTLRTMLDKTIAAARARTDHEET